MRGRTHPAPAALVLPILFILALTPLDGTAQTTAEILPPAARAVLDSLAAWHGASRPDRVDSLAAPAIATARAERDTTYLLALLLSRGRTRAAFGLAREGEPDLREARELARSRRDTTVWLRAQRWLAVAIGLQGGVSEARRSYRDLEALATAVGDSVHMSWAWVGLAYDHYLTNRPDSAGALYGAAAGVLDRAGISRGAIWALNGQGLALRQAGRYDEAMASFRRLLELARSRDDALNEAVALNQLGRLELHFGDPGRALIWLRQAEEIHRRYRHHREQLLAEIDIAEALDLMGREDDATAALEAALVRAREHGLADIVTLASNQLADILLDRGRSGAAAAIVRGALAMQELPSVMAETELGLRLALALAARDSAEAALAVLDAAVARGPGGVSLELAVAEARGRMLLALDRPAEARRSLEPAVARAREVEAEGVLLPLLTCLGRAHLAAGASGAAIATFVSAADVWESVRSLPADPIWREQRSAAAAELFSTGAAMLLVHPADRPPAERVAAAFSFMQRYKARTLQERMAGPGRPLASPAAPISPARLRSEVLTPGEAVLDLVQGPATTVLVYVGADTALAAVLPGRHDLESRLRHLEVVLTSPDVRDAAPAVGIARGIVAAVPPAIRDRLAQAERVYWCPDGCFHRLPLALVAADGGGLLPAGCEIARLPAVSLLARLRAELRPAADPARILAVAGYDSVRSGTLPGARAETRWLARHLRAVTRNEGAADGLPDDATWSEADVVHLAAHVNLDPQQPWNTAVVLAPDAVDAPRSGELRAADVGGLPLRARLAVLSGCRTAGDREVGGEGLLGLAAGFLAAGTPAVVATLWAVDDHTTARFMTAFYGALAAGHGASAALGEARSACRRHPATAAPRYWAGFVFVGDGALPVPVRERSRGWPLAAGLLLAAGGSVWLARRPGA